MLAVILTCLVILAVLLLNEWWWHKRTHGEISRKFVHVSVGTFVAFWPLYLSWRQIELLSLAFVLVVLVSQQLKIFQTIHSVQRPTLGELFFGAAAGVTALLTHSPAIFTAALLTMSLADGLAAIVGVKYGAPRAYQILGNRKSAIGTATFFVVSMLILIAYSLHQHTEFGFVLALTALAATALENIAGFGLDNLLIPILITVVLKSIT